MNNVSTKQSNADAKRQNNCKTSTTTDAYAFS